MKAKEKVVYVPPVYEEVQHEVTSVDDNNVPLRTSFHTDVSLLQRIDNMRVDAQTLREIKESMQPMIDNSNFPQSLCINTHIINTLQQRYISMKRSSQRNIIIIYGSNFMLNFLINRRNINYFIFSFHNQTTLNYFE